MLMARTHKQKVSSIEPVEWKQEHKDDPWKCLEVPGCHWYTLP